MCIPTSMYRLCLPLTRPYNYLKVAFTLAHDQSVVVFHGGVLRCIHRAQNNKTEERVIWSVRCGENIQNHKNKEISCKLNVKR